jgi:hypothetical protein
VDALHHRGVDIKVLGEELAQEGGHRRLRQLTIDAIDMTPDELVSLIQ